MNLQTLKGLIGAAAPSCPEPDCTAQYSEWPDADETEDKVMYIAQDALFAGSCSNGHMIEFHLAELKAGEVTARTRTERTMGQRIAQIECQHRFSKQTFEIPEGGEAPSLDGWVVGPVKMLFCLLCGGRQVLKPRIIKPGSEGGRIILP